MATLEIDLPSTQSRRDFVTLFSAKKRKSGGLPPKRPSVDRSSISPEPPNNGGFRLGRRPLIIAGSILAAGTTVAAVTRPWEQLVQLESLESLVTQAKKMEDEFTETDLSNKEVRNQYVNLLAGIFVRYYPLGVPKQQLLSSIIWFDLGKDFEETYVKRNQDPFFTEDYLRQIAARTPAFTTSDDGKIYINSTYEIYQTERTKVDKKFPQDWNPLKSLRLTLIHEFSHQIVNPSQDPKVFSVVDSGNILSDKKIKGFEIRALNNKRELVGLYHSMDEACVELLSKYINTDLFHSFISEYGDRQGNDVTTIMTRFDQLLNVARITRMELARFHKDSNLKGFLLLLAERGGINSQRISEADRIAFGFSLFEALIRNNQPILQDYMNHARSFAR